MSRWTNIVVSTWNGKNEWNIHKVSAKEGLHSSEKLEIFYKTENIARSGVKANKTVDLQA